MATSVIFRNVTNTYFDYRREIKKKKNRFKLSAYEKLDDDLKSGIFLDGNTSNSHYGSYNINDNMYNGTNNGLEVEMQEDVNLLPPFWIEKIEECSEDLNIIKTKLVELQKLQKRKLVNVMSNDEQLSENISHMSTELTFLIKNCEQKIQSISKEENDGTCKNGGNNDGTNNVIDKLKKNAKASLASQLQTLSQTFHKKQKSYLKECQKLVNEYGELTGYEKERLDKGITGSNNMHIEVNENEMFADQMFYEQVNKIITTSECDMSKRNSDLKKIADTVVDLHTIFKELSIMLVDQGTVLDQIDYNVDVTMDKSEHGLKKLKILQKRENDRRAKRLISFLTTLIFVLLILIIIKHLS